jgi:hypothetical protein
MNMTQKKQQVGFEDWVDMWEKAQADGTFKDAPKPPAPSNPGSFFGMQYAGADADLPPGDAETEYWNQVYQRSNNAGDAPDIAAPEVLQEQKKPVEKPVEKPRKARLPERKPLPETRPLKEAKNHDPSNAELGKIAKAQLRSPNPIYYYSAGKDQEPHVTQNWAMGGKEVQELEEVKVKLHQLENKLATMMGEGKPDRQVQKLESELRKLRDRLDELSDSLHGGWVGEPKD